MNITVIGAGYVGLVTGACFAELGNQVTCVDVNEQKIANLRKGILPIFEPGLETMIQSNMAEARLSFATHISQTMQTPDAVFIAVGTPSDKYGSADIQYVLEAARGIGAHINQYAVIVDKSTVPVGMGEEVKKIIQQEIDKRHETFNFDVVSNPEFLREGAAIEDFMRPDRVIIGLNSPTAKKIMLDLYLPIVRHPERIFFMRMQDAEMTKYAANAMLANRISFMNEMALLCDKLDVDIENVRIGIGADTRIGNAFLNAGCGYGGSCFPKDVRALIHIAKAYNIEPHVLNAIEQRNNLQKLLLVEKIKHVFGNDLSQLKFALWGLAFKPGTDDMREASSITLMQALIASGASINAYDPKAMPMAKKVLPAEWLHAQQIHFSDNQYDALTEVDALLLVTEWKSFSYPDIDVMKKKMRREIIFDGRNQLDPKQMQDFGFEYHAVGRDVFKSERSVRKLKATA